MPAPRHGSFAPRHRIASTTRIRLTIFALTALFLILTAIGQAESVRH